MGLASLTGLDTPPVGALEQNIFYVNQVMQFGKLLAVFQQHPTDASQTIVTVFIALAVETSVLAKKKEFVKVPVLRNLVPAQVLAGQEFVQHRQLDQRGAAGLRPQSGQGDRGDPRAQVKSSGAGNRRQGCALSLWKEEVRRKTIAATSRAVRPSKFHLELWNFFTAR